MGELLISKKIVKGNKELKRNQRKYLWNHIFVRGKAPKAKLGKVIVDKYNGFIDCTDLKNATVNNEDVKKCVIEGLDGNEIIEHIKKFEIKGMSGSGYPDWKKIQAVKEAECEKKYFIVNAIACDPALIHDAFILNKFKDDINRGIEIIKKIINFDDVIIASPVNVTSRYPIGAEKVLIKHLLGIDLKKDEITAEHGILVMNIQTVFNIAEAFKNVEKCDTKFITVCDFDSGKGLVAKVKDGQKIEEVLNKTKFKYDNKKIYSGTGAMEAHEINLDSRISVTDNMIGIVSKIPQFDNNSKCRGCGACERNCPEGVSVRKIMKAIEKNNIDDLRKYGIEKCIGCGTCSYYCKAGKNTMQIIQETLAKVM